MAEDYTIQGNAGTPHAERLGPVTSWFIHVRLTLLAEMLGTKALDPEIFTQYILSKAPPSVNTHVEQRMAEHSLKIITEEKYGGKFSELSDEQKQEVIDAAKSELSGTSIFHRDSEGNPVIHAYQMKGMLKNVGNMIALSARHGVGKSTVKGKPAMYDLNWPSNTKGKMDTQLEVLPRFITVGSSTGICERPLRTEDKFGKDQVCLARSETVAEGSTLEFVILLPDTSYFNPKHIAAVLDYGLIHGLGQWRNAGKGQFEWELLGMYKEPVEDIAHLLNEAAE
jgi:hypothetical protein